jgi:hypothetical protein
MTTATEGEDAAWQGWYDKCAATSESFVCYGMEAAACPVDRAKEHLDILA